MVTNARTVKVETERRGDGLAATGVHFTIKGPDGQIHEGALEPMAAARCRTVGDASLAALLWTKSRIAIISVKLGDDDEG